MTTLALIFGSVGAIGGLSGIVAVIYIVPTWRKLKADTKKLGVESDVLLSGEALKMYDRAMAEAREAKQEALACRREVDTLRDHVDVLEGLLRAAGLTPPPVPPRLYQIGGSS